MSLALANGWKFELFAHFREQSQVLLPIGFDSVPCGRVKSGPLDCGDFRQFCRWSHIERGLDVATVQTDAQHHQEAVPLIPEVLHGQRRFRELREPTVGKFFFLLNAHHWDQFRKEGTGNSMETVERGKLKVNIEPYQ